MAIALTDHQQDTLELCCVHSGKTPAQFDWNVRITETRAEMEGLWRMEELSLIQIRSVSYTKGDAQAVLYRMTPKGDAVMHANWEARK